jgi:hypothetical protein
MTSRERFDDVPGDGQGVGVVGGVIVGNAGDAAVDVGPAEVLVADLLARRRLDQRGAADEDGALTADDDGLVAHGRDVGPAGRARAHDDGDLGDAERREPGLVVEDPAEVLLVREGPGLVGQEDPARVDEVDARQPVLEGHFLGPDMFLDGHREIGPALDGRVVGHDEDLSAVDDADPRDQAGAGGFVIVLAGGGKRTELEERRPRIEEPVEALADQELAAGLVQVPAFRRPPFPDLGQAGLVLVHDAAHLLGVPPVLGAPRVDLGLDLEHGLFRDELVAVIDDAGLALFRKLAELELDPQADRERVEIAIDDLGRQPDAVVELGDADGVGRLVLEGAGRHADDGVGQELAGLGQLGRNEFAAAAPGADEPGREGDLAAALAFPGLQAVPLRDLAPVA